MGKTSRKTKAKKKDFNKVKLKVGKGKVAASNVTKTDFKSQSIFVPTQLKPSNQENEIVTHKRHNLTDLLGQVNHFSPTFRFNALNGLKELLNYDFEHLSGHMVKIFERVSKCITDVDSEVRKATVGLFKKLFSLIDVTRISPHFTLLLSHLYCAMSHISSDVQADSLKVLDFCLDQYPELFGPTESAKILHLFLEMISTTKCDGAKSNQNRSLLMKLSKKETAISWRIKVLSRILKLLSVSNDRNVSNRIFCHAHTPKIHWKCDHAHQHLLATNAGNLPGLTFRNLLRWSMVGSKSDHPGLKDVVETIVPLLLQCWVEVTICDIIDEHTMSTQLLVVHTTLRLCKSLLPCETADDQLQWLKLRFEKDFRRLFFDDFPFTATEQFEDDFVSKKRRKKNENQTKEEQVCLLNIGICNLMVMMYKGTGDKLLSAAAEFLSTQLRFNQSAATSHDILRQILDCCSWLLKAEDKGSCDKVSNLVCKLWVSVTRQVHKFRLLRFITENFENHSLRESNPGMSEFIASTTHHLLVRLQQRAREASTTSCSFDQGGGEVEWVLRFVKCAARRRFRSFVTGFETRARDLLRGVNDINDRLFCTTTRGGGCGACRDIQVEILECVIPNLARLDSAVMTQVLEFCSSRVVSSDTVCYVVDVIFWKVTSSSLLRDDDVTQQRDKIDKAMLFRFALNLASLGGGDDITKTARVTNHVMCAIKQLEVDPHVLHRIVKNFLLKTLQEERGSRMGILKMMNSLLRMQIDPNGHDLTQAVGRFLAICVTSCLEPAADDVTNPLIASSCHDVMEASVQITESCIDHLTQDGSGLRTVEKLMTRVEFHKVMSPCVGHVIIRISHNKVGALDDVIDNIRKAASLLFNVQ